MDNDAPYFHKNQRRRRNYKQQWLTRRNKCRRDKFGHILGKVDEEDSKEIIVSNTYDALVEVKKDGENNNKVNKANEKE